TGNLIADPEKFPHGMKATADYVHAKGLKFGLHQPAGMHDCAKISPGSQGNEERDAALFGQWGVDFIKYDQCDYIHAKDTTPGAPHDPHHTTRQRVDIPYDMAKRYTLGVISVDLDLKQGRNTITLDNPTSQEEDVRQSYMKMAAALNRTGREIMFSTSGAPRP